MKPINLQDTIKLSKKERFLLRTCQCLKAKGLVVNRAHSTICPKCNKCRDLYGK